MPPTWLFVVNRIVDAIFIVDVVLQFLLMYQEGTAEQGRRWEYRPAKIANRYLRGWFLFDVLSIAPMAFDVAAFDVDVAARGGQGASAIGCGEGGASELYVLLATILPVTL